MYQTLVRKPEVKRSLRKYRHRWEIILKWIFKCGLVWTKVIGSGQGPGESYCKCCTKSWVLRKLVNFLIS